LSQESSAEAHIRKFLDGLEKRNPHEPEFQQAVAEVAHSIMPMYLDHDAYRHAQILERLTEPDRIVTFRVTWQTDDGTLRANRAWRVQFNHALGPYKGGLRFHPSVNQSVLKFLGFEQVLKNSLTGLPMGGAKGGSNFNPKGKSADEIMRFCQSLMTELQRHIGQHVDIPAGDIGVGTREISYLFGQYMRISNTWTGVLTGKGCSFGGSEVRKQATGYGCVYFLDLMLQERGHGLAEKRIAISGSGNVALYAAEKAIQLGAKVLTLSDSDGFIHVSKGLDEHQFERIRKLKEDDRGRLAELDLAGCTYHKQGTPWSVPCDVAMPCATQNEIDVKAADALIANDVLAVCEGANMPTSAEAGERFRAAGVLHAPGKASNAGGVAVSGLELSQNAMRLSWSIAEVDAKLQSIMADIHRRCVEHGRGSDQVSYIDGANIAGFQKVADAMLAYGAV